MQINFNLEIKFSQLLPKLKELIKKAKFQDILKLLSSHTDFIGLSILLISLFTFNLALNQDKKKKQHEYLKDLTPGKIQVFEGKVIYSILHVLGIQNLQWRQELQQFNCN